MTISFVKFSFLCYFFSSSILFLNLNFQHTNLHLFKNINSFRLLLFHFFYIIVIVYAARCLFCMDLIDFWCGCTLHGMHSFQFIVVDVLKGKLLVPTIKLKNTTWPKCHCHFRLETLSLHPTRGFQCVNYSIKIFLKNSYFWLTTTNIDDSMSCTIDLSKKPQISIVRTYTWKRKNIAAHEKCFSSSLLLFFYSDVAVNCV